MAVIKVVFLFLGKYAGYRKLIVILRQKRAESFASSDSNPLIYR